MSDRQTPDTVLFLKPTRIVVLVLLIVFLLGGLAVRLIDLTDLPLELGATRELHSFIMARGLYYSMNAPEILALPENTREFGITTGGSEPTIEPPIFEHLVAFTYRILGQENMLVPRLYSILFWLIGGIGLFLLARKLMPLNGAFAALAFYLLTTQQRYTAGIFNRTH